MTQLSLCSINRNLVMLKEKRTKKTSTCQIQLALLNAAPAATRHKGLSRKNKLNSAPFEPAHGVCQALCTNLHMATFHQLQENHEFQKQSKVSCSRVTKPGLLCIKPKPKILFFKVKTNRKHVNCVLKLNSFFVSLQSKADLY